MRRLAIFAHWDADAEVKRYVLHHLRALRSCCERVLFVSTAPLGAAEVTRAAAVADAVTLRPNVGFDFGMWQHALGGVDPGAWDELVLANSSVFGPFRPLEEAFARMAGHACDAWSMTDNHEIKWHLQSWFLVFRGRALRSPALSAFFSSVYPYRSKWQTTLSYEIGLTSCLVEAGLELRALAPATDLFPRWPLSCLYRDREQNPSCRHPIRLIARGVPYLKVEVVRDNPCRVPLGAVRRAVRATGWDTTLIELDGRPRSG